MENVCVQTSVAPLKEINPIIYAYTTPEVERHNGWSKIGYTEAQTAAERVKQQTHTAGVKANLEWEQPARFTADPLGWFKDHDFHRFLTKEGEYTREKGTEWFAIAPEQAKEELMRFAAHVTVKDDEGNLSYTLRDEQEEAVNKTLEYFAEGGKEFLWNAKPRFGKTLATYDLIQRMGFQKVLIVTNRPSIANSWADDFRKFIGWKGEYAFVSENDAVKDRPGVMSRQEYTDYLRQPEHENVKMIAFESLPSLKGARVFGGEYDKLVWLSELNFDLLVIDEAHEGVDTEKTDTVFAHVNADRRLHLSGTPFKALANQKFGTDQIFNWSYADEQEAKDNWSGEEANPYESLPRMSMYTYQISEMMADMVRRGADLTEDETVDYAFDLSEFFAVSSGRFKYEDEVRHFLDALTTQEKYPFSSAELREALPHTMWYLNRVDSVKALARMLRDHPVFKDYEIIEAVGKGSDETDDESVNEEKNKKSLDKVRSAIAQHDRTITLTVGQLTVGVTVPEWSGVLMLCNLKSPASYMQAAFRAQNPWSTTKNGKRYRKENAYVFDFDPTRTLTIFDEFANNLIAGETGIIGGEEERKNNVRRLLNFFPVIGEDDEGKMIELDAAEVLSIPRHLMSVEVVRRGFMSNFLFQNVSAIFNAPAIVKKILEQVPPSEQGKIKQKESLSAEADGIEVDDSGEPVISKEKTIGTAAELFGEKVYTQISDDTAASVAEAAKQAQEGENMHKMQDALRHATNLISNAFEKSILDPVADNYDLSASAKKQIKKQMDREVSQRFSEVQKSFEKQKKDASIELAKAEAAAGTQEEKLQAQQDYDDAMKKAAENYASAVHRTAEDLVKHAGESAVEKAEKTIAKQKIKTVGEEVRAHLRGFSRTIPSFIMAYGDEDLTLQNFDSYVEEEPFLEVTGITIEQFKLLRDGGQVQNEETGEMEEVAGRYFNEGVFNDSIKQFLRTKEKLADYFDEGQNEDIFDYIPPQKTNQIFTPKTVARRMLDLLEQENPGCFDDPERTFADLYMKSGIYIAEIIKRLYNSAGLKEAFPDNKERMRHILSKQVYGMAPTRVIFLIARNYILGFDKSLAAAACHLVQADAQKASSEGTLQSLVDKAFGFR